MSYKQVLEAALALPVGKQQKLMEQLEENLAAADDGELSAEWEKEIDRRLAEYKAGKAKTITWEEAKERMQKLRKSHGKKSRSVAARRLG